MNKNEPYKQLNLFETKRNSTKTQTNETNQDIIFFEQFAWAVPEAFSDPLDLCRFEEGDLLYNTQKAYLSPWSAALKHIKHGVQVTFPPRAIQKVISKEDDSVFESNWYTLLKLDFLTFENNKIKHSKHIKTTQGALYTFLWTGDSSVLGSDVDPKIPPRRKALKETIENACENLINDMKSNHKFSEAFILPYDKSNSILRQKRIDIIKTLKKLNIEVTILYDTPKILNGMKFAPTLQIIGFLVDSSVKSILHEGVKSSVYKPSKDRKSDKDQFRIQSHGIYINQY